MCKYPWWWWGALTRAFHLFKRGVNIPSSQQWGISILWTPTLCSWVCPTALSDKPFPRLFPALTILKMFSLRWEPANLQEAGLGSLLRDPQTQPEDHSMLSSTPGPYSLVPRAPLDLPAVMTFTSVPTLLGQLLWGQNVGNSGNGCTPLEMYLMLLNCTLKKIRWQIYVFYHSF